MLRIDSEAVTDYAARALAGLRGNSRWTDLRETMEDFIAYHSVELMGHDYSPTDSLNYFTQKPEKYVRGAMGARVWLIVGKRDGRRTSYRLAGAYTASSMCRLDKSTIELSGHGLSLEPSVDITKMAWFKNLLAEQSNFSLGLNRTRKPEILDGLETLLAHASQSHAPRRTDDSNIAEHCIYTIVTSDILEQHALDGSPMTRTERKVWSTAKKLFADAKPKGTRLPVLFADAKDCSRLLYWGILDGLDTSLTPPSTRYAVDRLRPFRGVRSPQELRLMRAGEFIAPGFIRPYAICQTPDFLSQAPEDVSDEVFLCSGEDPAPETLVEGAAITVTVSKYERNQAARRQCISHYGHACWVCQMDFASAYGEELGRDYIHVHHITPISTIGEAYVIDPMKDLRPICPNCHAMIHRRAEAMDVTRLRQIVVDRQRGLTQQ